MTVPPSADGDARGVRSTLSPAARALLAQRAQARDGADRIPRRGDDGPAPLSSSQQRLWLFAQIEPGSAAYNRPRAFEIVGALDVVALERALGEIVRRHAVLRSAITSGENGPVQQPVAATAVQCRMIDLRAEPAGARDAIARDTVEREARAPFDLASGVLLRAMLVRTADDVHTLVLTVHHSASDGWSDAVLFGELGSLYAAYAAHEPSPLAEPALQYADYALWQRERLASGAMAPDLEFWQRHLAGAPPTLELPPDRPRGAEREIDGAVVARTIPRGVVDAVMGAVGRESRATLSMTLLAAFQVLLSRYSGQRDVVVGMPVAGRTRAELETLIGCFINTLPLRADLSDDPTFRDLLDRTRTSTLDALAHQELPFDALVEALVRREREGGGRVDREAPVVQALLNVRNMPPASLELRGLSVRAVSVHTACSLIDLSLDVTETADGLQCVAEYPTSIFECATIERLLGHFETLLGAIAVDPDRPVSRLPLLSPSERHRAIVEWNDTAAPLGFETTLHELVATQAARTPDAIAVVDDAERVTYAELRARAARIANDLRRLGVRPEVPVGVCMERSVGLAAAILGTLEAGGAYLPLDPSLPADRLAFIVQDAAPAVLLIDRASLGRVSFDRDRCIVIDDAYWASPTPATVPAGERAAPSSVAYIIYTSGSTGEPKGVLNTHRGACNRMLWIGDMLPLTAADAVLHKAPISFDASVGEIFCALVTGARLVMARPGGHLDGAYLARTIAEHEITMLDFVPSLLQRFLEDAAPAQCRSVRHVIVGGEVMSPSLPSRVAAVMPDAALYNMYGPTEAAIEVTVWRCDPRSTRASVPIGRPLPNVQLYALDEHLEPVPVGALGELYIGGVAVARGYLNRPELTAERFVRDPFSADPLARLYRTGDLVRQDADGVFDYVGRDDDQVKIHGVRIELGEIEAVLARHSAVRDCAVVAAPSASGDDRLVAYVVATDDAAAEPVSRRTLREHARAHLPELLVPAAVVFLDALPRTSSGKIDRRALPAPSVDAGSAEEFVAPRTPAEEAIAAIWRDVLHVPRVGLRDNFFDLGGYSLAATSVVSRIRDQLQRDAPLRVLFDHPVLEEFAAALECQPAVQTTTIPAVARARVRRGFAHDHGTA